MNLLALIEEFGYNVNDTMYYFKERGKGLEGLEAVTSMAKVIKMKELFENEKVLNLIVIRHNSDVPPGLNKEETEADIPSQDPLILRVDRDGVSYISEEENVYPVAMDMSECLYIGTQQSCNFGLGKPADYDKVVDEVDSDDEWMHELQHDYKADHDKAVASELEYIKELKRKRQGGHDGHNNKKRGESPVHFEGETDVEELYEEEEEEEEESEPEAVDEEEFISEKDKKGKGPTSSRSH